MVRAGLKTPEVRRSDGIAGDSSGRPAGQPRMARGINVEGALSWLDGIYFVIQSISGNFLRHGCESLLSKPSARSDSTIFAKSAGLVECGSLAGAAPESDSVCSVGNNAVQIADACAAGVVCRRPVLSHPGHGAAGVRGGSVVVKGASGLASGLVDFDTACDVVSGRGFGRHHCERDDCSDFTSVGAEAAHH